MSVKSINQLNLHRQSYSLLNQNHSLYLMIIVCIVLLTACSERIVLQDEGNLCFSHVQPTMGESEIELGIQVSLPDCLSSSCDVEREAECSVIREGNTIVVSSELSYVRKNKNACTDDCGNLFANCPLENVPFGEYNVVHGDSIYQIQVPNSERTFCFPESADHY